MANSIPPSMPPYLATCHVLAHLESPISLASFQQAMENNPFFRKDCVHPGLFLNNLVELGLLMASESSFVLSEQGKRFEAHLLQWNRHDPQVKKARQQRAQNPIVQERSPTHCPACGSRYCALYIFVLLYTRFLWGAYAAPQDPWVGTAAQYLAHLELPFHHYYLWDQRLQRQDLSGEAYAFLQLQLPTSVWQEMDGLLAEPLNLMGFLQDAVSAERLVLPYYQSRYRVLPEDLLQQTQALRFPGMAAYLDPQAPSGMGLVHLGPWLKDLHSQDIWAVLRCNAELQVYQWTPEPGEAFRLVRVHKACYTEQ